MSLIELEQVQKNYRRGETVVAALRSVDLRINRGELIAVRGPSGSGKTTLANLIGLLDQPTAGRVVFDGRDVSKQSDRQRCRIRNGAMGFVFQSFNLLPVLSALENVMLPLEIRGLQRRARVEKASERLRSLGLEGVLEARPAVLSGGEQQRVAIARALVTDPSLVIADEPTANLDSDTAMSILGLIRRINRSEGTTFVLFTHDERLIDSTDRRILLRDGTVVEDEAAR